MLKQMRLGTKIALGFTMLVAIIVTLGGLAVWNMTNVRATTVVLADQKVPEVTSAMSIERSALNTMYAARGYVYSEEEGFLKEARKNLEEVRGGLKEAKELAAKYDLADLKKGLDKAENGTQQYETLLNETVAQTQEMQKEIVSLTGIAAKYTKACQDFVADQNKTMRADIEAATTKAADAKQMDERLVRINQISEIISIGVAARMGFWKSTATRNQDVFKAAQKNWDDVFAKVNECRKITQDAASLKQLDEIQTQGKAYSDGMNNYLTHWTLREEIRAKRTAAAADILETAKATAQGGMKETSESANTSMASLTTASWTMIIGLAAGVVLGVTLALVITRSITKPINRAIGDLMEGSQQVTVAAGQVSGASQSLAEGASEQAAAIEETSSSIEEMSSMTKQNASNAGEAKNLAAVARTGADKGTEAMARMGKAIEDIKKSADQTAKIIKTIDEIAFQTNLLALNAAVEAARAGDAGKGFAVVAEEVRNLAQRSAEAAKNTASMIEESVKNAEHGVAISQEVAKALDEIAQGSRKVNDLVGEIAAASTEQAQGIDQVNTAVTQMDKVTQSNAANAEESAAAAEELSAQAEQLNTVVRQLQAMVGGNQGAATETKKPAVHAAAHASAPAAHTTAAKAETAKTPAKGNGNGHGKTHSRLTSAESIIPMESDKDLARF
jgi:methyl-accepting chemotaxis protein